MRNPNVVVQLVVHNGSRYIRACLDAVMAQLTNDVEVLVYDNASTDDTAKIIQSEYAPFRIIQGTQNIGMWPAQELLLRESDAPFIVVLSVDVILDCHFIERAVRAFSDESISAIQPKVYQYAYSNYERERNSALQTRVLDTCGFTLSRARQVINIGHGEIDNDTYSHPQDIFGVEGAVPLFRRTALERARVGGMLIDPDYFWYGDDLDLAWRLSVFGLRQVFRPEIIAWHDRSTTKGVAKSFSEHFKRIALRRTIPIKKRRLDWSNVRFTIIKNDYIVNILRDLPWIAAREISTLIYTLLFEPAVLLELFRFARLLPRMLARRRGVQKKAVATPRTIHAWYR